MSALNTLARLRRSLARPYRAIQARSPYGSESGQALVEFALVLPLLLIIALGIMDVGKAVNYSIDETHLANQAARWAVVDKNPGEAGGISLQQYVRTKANTDELKNGGTASVADPLDIHICFPSGTSEVGDPVQVTVTSSYSWFGFLVGEAGFPAGSTQLRRKATMRLENEPTKYTADGACPA